MTLAACIAAMESGRQLHICVHDVSGILEQPIFALDFRHRMHDMSFCDEAKRTAKGYALCMRHKERVNALCVRHGRVVCGHCPFGLYEIAYPVVIKGKTACILYIGNLRYAPEAAGKRLRAAADKTGANAAALSALYDTAEAGDGATFLPVAKLLSEFIISTAEKVRFFTDGDAHWAVKQALQYIDRYFTKDIRVTEMAALCNIHPQYFGRLFKQQTGLSFAAYLTELRMRQAAALLRNGETVADTATACGYADVPYFSRVFRKYYGASPMKYRTNPAAH